ncbi:ATP-dependent RNA helicase DeaD [Hansschlegelia beijingensis]|uniref:ATP-dependent RNA helicase DeaD n=1 Tax=Hansschlegelia beijingensis TaxID=1133344 RepID=A0A7W6D5F8_9HYPH|nr:DEAD/DEAH box helicase [Hansschlegelia beijingensis]MBB3974595.1 ATP-dependent RNA helicase DeaD [Hansschlegelia beijingensis]
MAGSDVARGVGSPRRVHRKQLLVSLPLNDSPLSRALAARGYSELTPVQSAVVEEAMSGRDLLVSAQTGSGKTVAYGLAMGETLLADGAFAPAGAPLALVVAPTRELALQVERELRWLYAEARGRIVACVGGMDPRAERRQLELGAHIVVGTPGRLRDHIERRALDVSSLKVVVLDEADEMLDLGFRPDLEFILEATPAERRTLLFSATLPADIAAIARKFQRDAARIVTASEGRGHADIEHRAMRVHPREIGHAVINVLRASDPTAAIVFCSTREAVRRLHATLSESGFSAVLISGELGQAERNRALQALRDGRAQVCVATDVAARGIDLPNLGLVIHADLPHDAEILQHRSGRTGRAGRKGISVMLVPPSRRRKAETMMVDAGVTPVWSGPPTAESIRALDQERLFSDPALNEPASEEDLALARTLIARKTPEELAVALARLHRARLPAPEEVSDPGERHGARDSYVARERHGASDRQPRPDTAPAARRAAFGPSAWFRIAIGRKQNAEPRWLLPMICRRGGLTRQDIGSIRIFESESRFEIAAEAAEAFAAIAVRAGKGEAAISACEAPDGRIPVQAEKRAPHAKRSHAAPGAGRPGPRPAARVRDKKEAARAGKRPAR